MLSWFKLKDFPQQIFNDDRVGSDADYIDSIRAIPQSAKPMIMLTKEDFSVDVNYWFRMRGLEIEKSIIFYRSVDAEPHIDLKEKSSASYIQPNYGINIEFFGSGTMAWYNLPEIQEKNIVKTIAGTPFIRFKESELEIIDYLHNVRQPVLVRTDIPHSVKMVKGPRLIVSIRFREINQSDACPWEQILKILKNDLYPRYQYDLKIPGMTRAFELSALGYIASLVEPGKTFIEVGSWVGRSSYAISKNLPLDSELHCIDTWDYTNEYGDNLLDITKRHTAENSNDFYVSPKGMELLQNRYTTNTDWLGVWKNYTADCNNIVPFKMKSEDYSIPANVAGVYIDGDHSANALIADIKKFNISNNILICGDDCSWQHINGVVSALIRYETRERVFDDATICQRTLILLPCTKFWILLPTDGYWSKAFNLTELLQLL